MVMLTAPSQAPPHVRGMAPRRRPPDGATQRLLAACRGGSREARELLVRRYLPFVLRVASRASRRYLHLGHDDEASVALMAFNDAITIYRPDSRTGFVAFAEIVIRRRLIDYFRRSRHVAEIPLSAFEREDEDGEIWNPVDLHAAQSSYAAAAEVESRRQDLTRFGACLQAYGIGLDELMRNRPRHQDARSRAAALAMQVVRRPDWLAQVRLRHELPLKEMAAACGVSRKTLERRRAYIIGVVLLHTEDLPTLRAWANASAAPRRRAQRPLDPRSQPLT